MKKINLTTFFLMVYLIAIGIVAWPGRKPAGNYTEYGCIIGGTFIIILILRFIQIKRLKMREKRRKE